MALNTDKQVRNSLHIEEAGKDSDDQKAPVQSNLKLDAHGLPLVPQPSNHKDDPLVWTLVQYVEIDSDTTS